MQGLFIGLLITIKHYGIQSMYFTFMLAEMSTFKHLT